MWASARMPLAGSAVRRLAEEYVKYLSAFLGSSKKVLVVDLDNTLWGGILGEDGFDGIQLGSEYSGSAYVEVQRAILTLQARGVVLAINSKNNPSDAWEVIEKHPGMILRPDHFAGARINWNDKAGNLEELAEELNVGLEAFVYIDDSAAECERIRQSHPEVFTLHLASEPEKRAEKIRRLGVFDTLSFGTEDRNRTRMYRADTERKQWKSRAPSLEEYYASLAMELTIRPLEQAAVARAAQLTQRTNQFNLTTRRYTESEIAALTASDHSEVYTAHLTDRFGEDGIVGLAVVKRQEDALRMDTFLMSCRVLGRGVETAFLTFVLRRAEQLGMREVMGEYRPTKKNGIA
ncbi:MAG: HAD-IIIC family phosphatase, partial [bacterium]